jgi:hypothetical protein
MPDQSVKRDPILFLDAARGKATLGKALEAERQPNMLYFA